MIHVSTRSSLPRWCQGLILGFWFLNCLSIFILWTITFVTGQGWEQGLFVYQNGNIPIFHLIAEATMALVTMIGLLAWVRERRWGPSLALLGGGMFGYSAINSMGWAVHNNPALAIPMGLSLLGLPFLFHLTAPEPR